MLRLKIGYSPCPNDTFIMAALARGRIKSPVSFEPVLADVQTLNRWALEGRLEVTKLSFFALGKVRKDYGLLYSGAALGKGCGPLVVARPETPLETLGRGTVAAPGALTTARLLLSLYLGKEPRYLQMLFSEVMPAVAAKRADFGLVIHEGRFTYASFGLNLLLDLGRWWEEKTGMPIPLGGIAVRRDLPEPVCRAVDAAVFDSLRAARSGASGTFEYVRAHAQEMDLQVLNRHIGLYVNAYSERIGLDGQAAVKALFSRAAEKGWIPACNLPLMAYDAGKGAPLPELPGPY